MGTSQKRILMSILNWRGEIPSDLVAALAEVERFHPISNAVIVDHSARQHLEVYPSGELDSEQASRFNERLKAAIGDKIEWSVVLTNTWPK
jgi:hypothetical protein